MAARRVLFLTLIGAAFAASPAALSTPVLAQPAKQQTSPQQQPGEDQAVARIRAFYDDIQKAVPAAGSDPKATTAAVAKAVQETFDLEEMTRLLVGPRWKNLPAERQASLQEAFGQFFVASYAARLGNAAGGRFEVMPETEKRSGGRLVRTRVIGSDGKGNSVDYLVNQEGKVTDVYLGGTVSELAARRSEFASAMKAGGPEALEAALRQKAQELQAGSARPPAR